MPRIGDLFHEDLLRCHAASTQVHCLRVSEGRRQNSVLWHLQGNELHPREQASRMWHPSTAVKMKTVKCLPLNLKPSDIEHKNVGKGKKPLQIMPEVKILVSF
jgi:hypothetical protein